MTGPTDDDTIPTPVELRRVDAARNMRRFYRLDVTPDLFGGFLLLREWGRIGARGRVVAERHDSASRAAEAFSRHVRRKTRRGYGAA